MRTRTHAPPLLPMLTTLLNSCSPPSLASCSPPTHLLASSPPSHLFLLTSSPLPPHLLTSSSSPPHPTSSPLRYLDGISDDEITALEIPTGIPLVYSVDKDLKPIKSATAVAPLSGSFLVDPEELRRKQEEVANQSKLRYGIDEEATA